MIYYILKKSTPNCAPPTPSPPSRRISAVRSAVSVDGAVHLPVVPAAHHPRYHQVLLLFAEAVHPFRLPECEGEGRVEALLEHHERSHRNIFYLRKGNYFTINIKVKTISDFQIFLFKIISSIE